MSRSLWFQESDKEFSNGWRGKQRKSNLPKKEWHPERNKRKVRHQNRFLRISSFENEHLEKVCISFVINSLITTKTTATFECDESSVKQIKEVSNYCVFLSIPTKKILKTLVKFRFIRRPSLMHAILWALVMIWHWCKFLVKEMGVN